MSSTELVTIEDIKRALPSKEKTVTQEAVDIINAAKDDPEFQGESLLRTATTYESVLGRNKASIPEYLNAIRFCAYLITNEENYTQAYIKVFQHRDFVKSRMHASTSSEEYKTLSAAASRYRRSKVVVDILTVSQVPLDLMFTGQRYKALGVLANVMETAKLDRDKINAAKELLAATKGPDNVKMELDVGMGGAVASMQQQLDKQLSELALNQKKMLEAGYNITDVQKTGIQLDIIEGETVDG